jgi:hypothetical protein
MNAALFTLATFLAALSSFAQGTFQYDQQSWPGPIPPNILEYIQGNEPIGQSFTPSLPAVGFVQLELFDAHPNNGVGATVYVNLRSNSISGPIIASSNPVFLPDTPTGGGVTNFFFSGAPAVVPGTIYFFEIGVQSGDLWRINSLGANDYSAGTAFLQGAAQPLEDFWFREGVVIPEPSATTLLLLAGALWACFERTERSWDIGLIVLEFEVNG